MTRELIRVVNVEKIYDDGKSEPFTAIKNINLLISEGDFVCIMGPSGSGKTTLINMMTTIDYASSGDVYILDEEVHKMDEAALCKFRGEQLGYIFQESQMIDSLTLVENIILKLNLTKNELKTHLKEIKDLAKKLEIVDVLNSYPYECSSGQKQRASIIRALVSKPILIVGDEPTGNLDSLNSKVILEQFQKLNQEGLSVLLVSHDPVTASYANKVYYIVDGKIKTTLNRSGDQDSFYHEIVSLVSPEMEE